MFCSYVTKIDKFEDTSSKIYSFDGTPLKIVPTEPLVLQNVKSNSFLPLENTFVIS